MCAASSISQSANCNSCTVDENCIDLKLAIRGDKGGVTGEAVCGRFPADGCPASA